MLDNKEYIKKTNKFEYNEQINKENKRLNTIIMYGNVNYDSII